MVRARGPSEGEERHGVIGRQGCDRDRWSAWDGRGGLRRFAEEGAKVLIVDVLDDLGNAVSSELGASVEFVRGDVTSEADWEIVAREVSERWGALDVLVNNAAILHLCPVDRTDLADFERVLRVNTVGPFLGIKACLPALRDGGGSIVNVGSTDSISGVPTTRRTRRRSSLCGGSRRSSRSKRASTVCAATSCALEVATRRWSGSSSRSVPISCVLMSVCLREPSRRSRSRGLPSCQRSLAQCSTSLPTIRPTAPAPSSSSTVGCTLGCISMFPACSVRRLR